MACKIFWSSIENWKLKNGEDEWSLLPNSNTNKAKLLKLVKFNNYLSKDSAIKEPQGQGFHVRIVFRFSCHLRVILVKEGITT